MEYIARYGLEFNPFIKNSKDIIIETKDYRQITYRLEFLTKTKGFGVITGEPGRGKTTAVRHWSKGLSAALYKVVYTSLSTLSLNEFYRHLAEEFGLESKFRKSDNYKNIQAEINRYTMEKRITPVFVIDEANHISSTILNDFKMLFNFEMDSKDRAVVLLIGQPQLNATLRQSSNEAIRQRITMNYHLGSLEPAEGKSYIESRLKEAGCHQRVFDEAALDAIVNAANGIPRNINKMCDMCLLLGHSKELPLIDAEAVMSATHEIDLG